MEDATARLVHAMTGRTDEVSISLASRVLGSQFGTTVQEREQHFAMDLSSTWRRITRKASSSTCKAEIETLYKQLELQCQQHQQEPHLQHLPPKLLTVLTKLMGKRMVLPKQSILQPSSTANSFPKSQLSGQREGIYQEPTNSNDQGTNKRKSKVAPVIATGSQIHEERKALEKEEALLLRECLYSLQGIDGERIRYYHRDHNAENNHGRSAVGDSLMHYDGIRARSLSLTNSLLYSGRVLETRLGSGAMDALRISGEAGWLYRRIQTYIQEVQNDESKGIIARAFAGTLGDELREYHSLLTQYESQLSNLTLRQLLVDLRLPTIRLRILALLTDGVRHLSGGHLLSALYQHTLHGDTRHAKLVQNILCAASKPWFDILYTWTTQGVLSDPHHEFFVTEHPDVKDQHLWKDKYQINKDQIPDGILDMSLVGPAFNVGKGINFIRRCLLDGKWAMHLESDHGEESSSTTTGFAADLGYRYRPYLERNIPLQRTLARAAELVHSHILRTLRRENHLMEHLYALKQFLFLGQGDFFSALVDGLHSEFREQPGVAGIYKHTLLAIVEGALRTTNAKYLPSYILDRLQVELLLDPDDEANGLFGPDSHQRGDESDQRTVWDIFILDYQVPDPLFAIVHHSVLDKYKLVFSLLFRLKRVEFMLNFTWRQSATLQHALQTYGQYNGIHASNSKAYAQASYLLRKISILRQNMMHLIVNLKSYFMFEVLEGGWRRLESEIDASKTLDEVIDSHDRYIDGIVRKSLLRTEENRDLVQQKLADQVQMLLKITGDFCSLQERVFHQSLLSADIASQKRLEADRRTNQGKWGFDSEQDITEEEDLFGLANSEMIREVTRMARIYNENALELLDVLGARVSANPDDLDDSDNTLQVEQFEFLRIAPTQPTVALPAERDVDSQRFLIAQLDHNNFYGAQASRK